VRSTAACQVPDLPPLQAQPIDPNARAFARPWPIRTVGFLARGSRRDLCVDAVLELANLIGRLPACIDLLDQAPHATAHCQVDLVLISRSSTDPQSERQRRGGQAVLQSGAPVLLLPQGPAQPNLAGERALIVWDGSLSALSALRSAVPLLEQSRQIMVVDASEGAARVAVDSAMTFLDALPGERLLDLTRLTIDSKPLVLETAQLTNANFIVMGGFGRWGALPDIIDGNSDSLFLRARLPLLLGQ
jgi:hypothetical protein